MVRITRLTVYPLKSAAGIDLNRLRVGDLGPLRDREWMVVDAEGRALTQRECPKMALIRTALGEGRLVLSAPDRASCELPTAPPGHWDRSILLHGKSVRGTDAGTPAAAWLTAALGRPCRLVRTAPESEKTFTDAHPFLLASEASLAGLNERLPVPVPMTRFRPNLTVSGCGPHDEDGWTRIRAGAVILAAVKPCSRCSITTVDPETGETGPEPLKTLAAYRKGPEGKVLFGMNMRHETEGVLEVGQEVEIF